MRTVKDVLRAKGPKVYSIAPDGTVYEALKRMAKKNAAQCWFSKEPIWLV
jgi:predicted Fe-Mo cluster-binding NifX family protein